MEKYLAKEYIGEFFAKMYEANKGKKIDVSLCSEAGLIQVYYKEKGSFEYLRLTDGKPDIDGLVNSLSL